jgi:hypothetical protein
VTLDQDVGFGEDIGYIDNGSRGTCLGYWPPKTSSSISKQYGCPVAYDSTTGTVDFSLTPSRENGTYQYDWANKYIVGYAANGILLYNGLSDRYLSTWSPLAPEVESLSFDLCQGHADANDGRYHHHSYSSCLADQLKDSGKEHSRVYGFARDGFPIYGPYQSEGILAKSCWRLRDYSSGSATGCSSGSRSCQLVDEYDVSKGVSPSVAGPSFAATIVSSNGNTVIAANGVFYEDYFFNETCSKLGDEYLSEFNGHRHGSFGFHYHMTIDSAGDPIFPYITGPKLYGCVSTESTSVCGQTEAVGADKGMCTKKQSSSSTTISAYIIGTIIVVLFLFSALMLACYCMVTCLRRVRKLVPLPSYMDPGSPDNEVIADIPQAEAFTRYKDSDDVVGVQIVTANSYHNSNNLQSPIATATAIAV